MTAEDVAVTNHPVRPTRTSAAGRRISGWNADDGAIGRSVAPSTPTVAVLVP